MKEKKIYDRTLMLIGADHGEHLGEHGLSQHGGKPWEAVIRTPLIWRLPGIIPAGTRIKFLTENVDILPTLAGVAGIPLPSGKEFDGDNIFQMTPDSESARWSLSPDMIRSEEFKYINEEETGEEFLYNLKDDPGEENNLVDGMPEKAEETA